MAVAGASGDEFAFASKAPRTWVQCKSALGLYRAWCAEHARVLVPADTETVRHYLRHLVDAGRSVSTMQSYLTAISAAHRYVGHEFDRARLRDTLKGIRRLRQTPPREAKPLLADDLRGLLSALDLTRAIDARDAAMLAVGWAGALRQSELVSLDWGRLGKGDGFLVRDRRGITITLARSKGSQMAPVTVIIPLADMPTAAEAIDRWASLAKLEAGQPIFRAIANGHQGITQRRLARDFPARMIKARVHAYAMASGATVAEAEQLRMAVSGHSLRAGLITSAALNGTPEWKIRGHVRHRSAEMTARYVRAAAKWTDSTIKGVGF